MANYDDWIKSLTDSLLAVDWSDLITSVETELKYVGFDLEEVARKLKDMKLDDLGILLIMFHTRGSNASKILNTMVKSQKVKYQALLKKYSVKDRVGTDKTAMTLARISLAAPVHSIQVALKVSRLGIYSTVSAKSAHFGVNAMPYLLSYSGVPLETRKMIWEAYLILNVGMHYTIHKEAKSAEKTAEIIQKIKGYALLTATGAKESMKFETVLDLLEGKTFEDKAELMKRYVISEGDLNDMPMPLINDV